MPVLEEQSAEIWGECPANKSEAILWIERAGRICYRSEDKIVEGSGRKFVDNICKRGHLSVMEHSNAVIRSKTPFFGRSGLRYIHQIYEDGYHYTSGNYRAWMEASNKAIDDIPPFKVSLFSPHELVTKTDEVPMRLKRITVGFVTDRAVLAEITRHRDDCSFSVESQRYCDYSQDLHIIKPAHYNQSGAGGDSWYQLMSLIEQTYRLLRRKGERPEQARSILPNCTAVKLAMTASVGEWQHIFKLRCSPAAYPAIRNLLTPVMTEFTRRGWVL